MTEDHTADLDEIAAILGAGLLIETTEDGSQHSS
jgi:hypothetical protein